MFKKIKERFTPLEFSWVLYDVGNSAYTMLASTLIAIWFHALADDVIGVSNATAFWSYGASIATILVAFIGPICGTIADNKGFKKPIFTTALAIGVLCCICNGLVNHWLLFLIIYIITKVAYNSSLVFYDSMLTDVTSSDRMDEISSYGYAWGYIGSCIPFVVCLVFYILSDMLGIISPALSRIIGFAVTGIWWLVVTLPLLKNYKQVYYVIPQKGAIKECFSRLGKTLSKIVHTDKKVFYFLLAYFLYIDGVDTIITQAVNIGESLELGSVGLLVVLLFTQVVAFAFALVFSKLSKKYETVTLIRVCILGYFFVAIYAIFLHSLWQFGIMAFVVGMFQGSIQALSRSYYGKIIPKENAGEYFGLYDIFSKGAAFLGTTLMGVVVQITHSINIAVGTLAIFFIAGFFLIKIADNVK